MFLGLLRGSSFDSPRTKLYRLSCTILFIIPLFSMSHLVEEKSLALRLARPNILELQPYRCARDDYDTGILLDANENALGPPLDKSANQIELERYPDPYQIPLKKKWAAYRGHGLEPSNIFVGVGSDEAIDLLMRIFCRPAQDKIMQLPPTYGMYKVCAKVNDVAVENVPLTPDFEMDIPKIIESITPDIKLLFVCSPGNPTAKAFPVSQIEELVQKCPPTLMVVVDEAYVDFSTEGSAISLVRQYSNIIVLQTMSKAFGLAAIRCGYCISNPDVIQLMNNVKAPYNINKLTSRMACEALDKVSRLDQHVQDTWKERARVMQALESLDFCTRVYHSDANFVLFRLEAGAYEVYKRMADDGVVTRYRGHELHCTECLRVTIGTPVENDAFLELLQQTYKLVNGGSGTNE